MSKKAKHRLDSSDSWVRKLCRVLVGDRLLSTPWALVLIVLGAGVASLISINRAKLLPDQFESDAKLILKFARNETDEGGSFRTIANLYQSLHLVDQPTLAGLFGVFLAACLAALIVYRVGGIRCNVVAITVLLLYLVFSGVFFGTYTKEVIVLMALIVAASLASQWGTDLVLVGVLALVGASFRPYWAFIAAIYLVVRFVPLKFKRIRFIIPMMILFNIGSSLVIWFALNKPADFFRSSVNEPRVHTGEANTIIVRFISDLAEPVGGVVNNLLTMFSLMVPVPLLGRGGLYYVFIVLVFVLIWVAFVLAVRSRPDREQVLASRGVALFASFAVVQGLFEPDYGSALRHLCPLIPFIFLIWQPVLSKNDSENESGEVEDKNNEDESSAREGEAERTDSNSVLSLTPLGERTSDT